MNPPRHPLRRLSAATLALALCTAPLSAWAIDDTTFLSASALLQKAQNGGDEATIEANADRWLALLKADPGDPVARAYAGSAVALQATTTRLPWRKMGFAEDGLALIDKALAQLGPEHDTQLLAGTPKALLVRLTAASTFLALPSMFNRGPRGAAELQAVLKHPALGTSALGFRGAVWLRAGLTAEQDGDKAAARQWYGQVVASQAPQAAVAQAHLKALP